MSARENLGGWNRAEASLREAAERLIRWPLDPGRACAALESAKLALETLRREPRAADKEQAVVACGKVLRQAGRVEHLLERTAMLSFPGAAPAGGAAGYTPAGELQAPAQLKRFVLQG